MARGVNKVILIGNLGADPDTRVIPTTGNYVTNISVATSESWSDKQTGERREKTEWHRVVAFGRLAEIISQYCRKGSKIYIEGRLQTSKYTDNQGIERYTTDIIANEMQMLDSRGSEGTADFNNQPAYHNQPSNQPQQPRPPQQQAPQRANTPPQQPVPPPQAQQNYGPKDDIDSGFDDDSIPF